MAWQKQQACGSWFMQKDNPLWQLSMFTYSHGIHLQPRSDKAASFSAESTTIKIPLTLTVSFLCNPTAFLELKEPLTKLGSE